MKQNKIMSHKMKKIKKVILINIILFILISVAYSPLVAQNAKPLYRSYRNVLKPGDEGAHFNRLLPIREWWYFNVIFDKTDSELLNWSAMISFNHGSYLLEKPDILFITLYDNENKSYGGMVNRKTDTLQATTYGVNITFEDSWVKGLYPNWHLYVEDNDADLDHNIVLDLYFKALSLPYWMLLNTGHGSSRSLFGYYSINHCEVNGDITIDGTVYKVHGTGYHDHPWMPFIPKGALGFWDWFSVHFNNGYHAFIWMITPFGKDAFNSTTPRFCWITDGQNFTDIKLFKIEYLEFENTSIPNFKRPKSFHLTSSSYPILDLYLETKNMYEYIWKQTNNMKILAMWEGSCEVKGTITTKNNKSEVQGSAISEIIRIL